MLRIHLLVSYGFGTSNIDYKKLSSLCKHFVMALIFKSAAISTLKSTRSWLVIETKQGSL